MTTTSDPLELAAAYGAIGAVAIVGCPARTWFVDQDHIVTVLEALEFLAGRPMAVCHAQQLPFDEHVERAAQKLELEIFRCWAPPKREDRICSKYERPVEMLERASLLIAFPREDSDVTSADSAVVLTALEEGLPVLCVRRDSMQFFGPS